MNLFFRFSQRFPRLKIETTRDILEIRNQWIRISGEVILSAPNEELINPSLFAAGKYFMEVYFRTFRSADIAYIQAMWLGKMMTRQGTHLNVVVLGVVAMMLFLVFK